MTALLIAYLLVGLIMFLGALIPNWLHIRYPWPRSQEPLWFDLTCVTVVGLVYLLVWPYALWHDYREKYFPDEEGGW